MAQLTITRNLRKIGFLDVPDWAVEMRPIPLPQFNGPEVGLAIIAGLRGSPIACVVYPWERNTLDITRPTRLAWESGAAALPAEQAMIQLDARIDSRGDYFHVVWGVSRNARKDQPRSDKPWQVTLQIHEKGFCDADVRWDLLEERGYGKGYFSGFFRPGPSGSRGEGELYARLRFRGRGYGKGYVQMRSRLMREKGAASEVEFYLDLSFRPRLPFRSDGLLTFKVQAQSEGEESEFSIPWLLQKTMADLRSGESNIPLTLWIGRVNFDSTGASLYSDASVRRTLAHSLLENAPISSAEAMAVARWLNVRLLSQDSATFRNSFERLGSSYRITQLQTQKVQCEFNFHESVPAEKALDFLISLAKAVQERGGRLCVGTGLEE